MGTCIIDGKGEATSGSTTRASVRMRRCRGGTARSSDDGSMQNKSCIIFMGTGLFHVSSVTCDSGTPLEINTEKIAEKFIDYYWRQTLPFLGNETLQQNTGKPPVVVTLLLQIRAKYGDSIAAAKRDHTGWSSLIRRFADSVRKMPLRYLQNVGRECLPFLYDPPPGNAARAIRLYPGVAFCFRRFHGLIAELVQAAWTKWVRQQNLAQIGEFADLHEFLCGSRRAALLALQNPLRDLQRNLCFYCRKAMPKQVDVDHFVPWALYPLDLGHNFVLSHRECNSAKRDRLASEEHLSAWMDRNRSFGERLAIEFDRIEVLHNLSSTTRIAHWAYSAHRRPPASLGMQGKRSFRCGAIGRRF